MKKTGFVSSILQSIFFKQALSKAGKLSRNSNKVMLLLSTVFAKMQGGGGISLSKIKTKLKTLALLVKYSVNGKYKDVSAKNIIFVLAGMIYFVSPIDLIPDFLPIIGFGDDIALITFIYNSISKEIEKFEGWLLGQEAKVLD